MAPATTRLVAPATTLPPLRRVVFARALTLTLLMFAAVLAAAAAAAAAAAVAAVAAVAAASMEV